MKRLPFLAVKLGCIVLLLLLGFSGAALADNYEAQYTMGDGTVSKGSFEEAVTNVSNGGTIQLLKDVNLSSRQIIDKDVTITSIDENNPCKIYTTTDNHEYLLDLRGEITLKNIIIDGGSSNTTELTASRALVMVNSPGKTVTIGQGAVLQNNNNITFTGAGGGICLVSGTVELDGGIIQNCRAYCGGGIAMMGSIKGDNQLVINKGYITNNEAWSDSHIYGGGAIYISYNGNSHNKSLEILDGVISENRAGYGGGIFINDPYCVVDISLGEIIDNNAKMGGGIYSSQMKHIEFSGGTISDNHATSWGGGVLTAPIDKVYFSGPVIIADNHSDLATPADNFLIQAGTSSFKTTVIIRDSLQGAEIWLSSNLSPENESNGQLFVVEIDDSYNYSEEDIAVFYSDNPDYHILFDEAKVQLYLQKHDFSLLDKNAEQHWYSCICEQVANHEPHYFSDWVITIPPTENTSGSKERTCDICKYTETQELAAQGKPDIYYRLYYNTNGGNYLSAENKKSSCIKDYDELPTPIRQDYIFAGWYYDNELTEPVLGNVLVNRTTVTLYAKWNEDLSSPIHNGVADWLNIKDHNAYLQGYDNGTFEPDNSMTRAEAAQLFYNLLLDNDVDITVSFADVAGDAWYADAVNTLASLNIIQGIGNNHFAPERPITRAEFITIAMNFTDATVTGENIFSDVSTDDWFYNQVISSINYGWITGYDDDTFRPNNTISRAEVTVITNRMLDRYADKQYVDLHGEELRLFPDVPADYWAYYQILEATNTHDYLKDINGETWTNIR